MSRRTHGRIGTDLWNEDSYRQLTPEEQWAYEFAYLHPELNRCGVVDYRPTRWAKLARGLTAKRLAGHFRRLNDTRHVVLDEDFEQLLVRTFVKHDGLLKQPMVVAAMVSDFRQIASRTIRIAFLNELHRIWHLPTLSDAERAGLALVFGARADIDRVRRAIGEGLVAPMAEAIAEGSVRPFSGPFLEHLPEGSRKAFAGPATEPSHEPPRAYAHAGVRPSSGSDSGSDSAGSPEPTRAEPPHQAPAEPPTPEPQGDLDIDEAIRTARRRASADGPLDGWDHDTVHRLCHGAADKHEATASEAYDRLVVLAGQPETRSPGRILEPAAWDWAGDQLLAQARSELAKQQTAALLADQAEGERAADTRAAQRREHAKQLADTDPDGWAAAQQAATAELLAEGLRPLPPLVLARALDIHERSAA